MWCQCKNEIQRRCGGYGQVHVGCCKRCVFSLLRKVDRQLTYSIKHYFNKESQVQQKVLSITKILEITYITHIMTRCHHLYYPCYNQYYPIHYSEMSIYDQTKVLSAATDLLRFFLSVAGGEGERRLLYVFFSRFLSASHIAMNYNTSHSTCIL